MKLKAFFIIFIEFLLKEIGSEPDFKILSIERSSDKPKIKKILRSDFGIPYREKKAGIKFRWQKKSSVKNFVTGKMIRHLPTNFLPGYLKTLIELKKH